MRKTIFFDFPINAMFLNYRINDNRNLYNYCLYIHLKTKDKAKKKYSFFSKMANKDEIDHTFIGDTISALDKLLDKESDFGVHAQSELGTSRIFPIASCALLDILGSVDDLKTRAKDLSVLLQDKHVIWANVSKAISLCFNKIGNTYCCECLSIISFPCQSNMPTNSKIAEIVVLHEGALVKQYQLLRLFCSECAIK